MRDDLPEIVAYAKQVGCKYVQLNSNGLRLAEDEAFVKRLAATGLSFVFMQFDGVDDAVYEKLRRRQMLEVKKRAIEQCGRYGIGVTLVPVIVPGVKLHKYKRKSRSRQTLYKRLVLRQAQTVAV